MRTRRNKELIVFDLDKTLSESKQPIDDDMAELLRSLLELKKVSVISGGSFSQFQKQLVSKLTEMKPTRLGERSLLRNLFLFPTCGSAFYRYGAGGWENVYTETLSDKEKQRIFSAFEAMFDEVDFIVPEKVYGELVEDRATQITFAAYGSQAPLPLKSAWDPDRKKRLAMIAVLQTLIPEFEIRTGGTSSIDVTRKGIDKAHGIRQMEKHLGVPVSHMLFVGDDLGPGGNDHPVIATGVEIVEVTGPEHTKEIIRSIITGKKG